MFGEMKEENITISKEQFEAIKWSYQHVRKGKIMIEYITLSDLVKKVSQDAVEKGRKYLTQRRYERSILIYLK